MNYCPTALRSHQINISLIINHQLRKRLFFLACLVCDFGFHGVFVVVVENLSDFQVGLQSTVSAVNIIGFDKLASDLCGCGFDFRNLSVH